ncbi:hypothetical protein BD770DRAFT_450989 [Pilaira anomala]|nr:hypothetical protein BD770DRAFT_450989 [Pilaira anomala]
MVKLYQIRCFLYTSPNSKNSGSLPPVIVKVQYTGNMPFYHRLINYGLSVTKRHSALPVVFAFIIYSATAELTKLAVPSDKQFFPLEQPGYGWAKPCYWLNSSSISERLQTTPLNQLATLGHFFFLTKSHRHNLLIEMTIKQFNYSTP